MHLQPGRNHEGVPLRRRGGRAGSAAVAGGLTADPDLDRVEEVIVNDMDDFEELRASARAHHVHFEVRPELQVDGDLWMKVGFEVRVWTVHDKGAHAMPGCRKCHDLLVQLDRIVRWALPAEERPTRIEVEPSGPILYDSREVPGTDEVAITIRLVHRDGSLTPVDSCEERCLRRIKERLALLGIPER